MPRLKYYGSLCFYIIVTNQNMSAFQFHLLLYNVW